ncbi:hypothetical protein ARTSIC4J27_957 [Pseudarthrobacter siccitolerans]|uniref:Uncharacterized protein n=1 Tax=Pseudarthrobacter siccitolerans TaxID=861266 RepID=A0A024GYL0_9MICC|nr:hypothetical protein ARTSIC4J27_957 [Pseudarthrobacter siccitolerans]
MKGQGTAPDPFRTGSPEDAAEVRKALEDLVLAAARPETNRLYRKVCK